MGSQSMSLLFCSDKSQKHGVIAKSVNFSMMHSFKPQVVNVFTLTSNLAPCLTASQRVLVWIGSTIFTIRHHGVVLGDVVFGCRSQLRLRKTRRRTKQAQPSVKPFLLLHLIIAQYEIQSIHGQITQVFRHQVV